MTGRLIAAYVFGSVARDDHDNRSDLDVLAIVQDGAGKVPEELVLSYVPDDLKGLEPSVSWYGQNRMSEMFDNGELFAWHLFQEAQPVFETCPFIKDLGAPNPYRGAREDVESFEKILMGIPDNLSAASSNAIYEMGLIYVCLRNICMSASATLCERPDFSRYSPFALAGFSPAPISRDEYDDAMACRMAGQRGVAPPTNIDAARVYDMYERLAPWISALRDRLDLEHGRS